MEKLYTDKIAKAKGAPTQPVPSQSGFQVSDANKLAMEEIADQMKSAQAYAAPSEDTRVGVPDHQKLDEAFSNMSNKPSMRIASVAKRKEIEERCGDVHIDELFVSGELRQRVVIRPGRLEVTYRTLKGKEDLYIKKRLGEVRDETIRYAEDRFLYMLLCAHVHTYNSAQLPSIFNDQGHISDKAFDRRFEVICDIPQVLMEEIWVNYIWFEARVRRALEAENLSGG
jgi:hypothetical protein